MSVDTQLQCHIGTSGCLGNRGLQSMVQDQESNRAVVCIHCYLRSMWRCSMCRRAACVAGDMCPCTMCDNKICPECIFGTASTGLALPGRPDDVFCSASCMGEQPCDGYRCPCKGIERPEGCIICDACYDELPQCAGCQGRVYGGYCLCVP